MYAAQIAAYTGLINRIARTCSYYEIAIDKLNNTGDLFVDNVIVNARPYDDGKMKNYSNQLRNIIDQLRSICDYCFAQIAELRRLEQEEMERRQQAAATLKDENK